MEPGHILVKTAAVALNPCDFKMPRRFPSPGTHNGCDWAGTVVALGDEVVQNGMFKIGDRVFAAVHGNNPADKDSGAYGEYLKAVAEFTWKIPDWMSFEEAAGLSGTCIATCCVALFRSLQLPGTFEEPAKKPVDVLIWGGASSIGTMAIQMVKLLGHRAITTCSPKNFDLVKSYGADAVFDYNSPTCAEDIKKLTRNCLRYVLDPFGEVRTMALCDQAMGRVGGRYTALEKYQEIEEKKTIKRDMVMGAVIHGKGTTALSDAWGKPADDELHDWGVECYKSIQRLIDAHKLRPHPIRVLDGRFDGILEGLDMLRRKEISAQKLVVRFD
ncbi:Alcohol dehydrogenase superfamily zinc-containing [Macrophomina phaseolina MS6]|uniref:Alcohol dehydrogenase superfamily zinc-containing n=1 Tax=Macrophomina phaseolina (strain MS6) TaxID=1126212 RepID=K2RAN0_MACPH|nr:Alcohol dehydrogenase superfamily zinc-containing [Macrophomina phaseolina MS6]